MAMAERALSGIEPTDDEARALLTAPDADVPALVAAAHVVRRRLFGDIVKVNFLVNVKSGICPEDCRYCSQSKLSRAPIDKYPLLPAGDVVAAALRGYELGARRVCLVASGRGPTDRDVEAISAMARDVHGSLPGVEVCACLGLISEAQASALKDAGVLAYNHNLNTSETYYSEICSTHGYQDRLATVGVAKQSGLSPCCGALFGMGESDADIVATARALRSLGVDSVPVNFLIPVPGTPLAGFIALTPNKCLKILTLMRFMVPEAELRIAGGREHHLRSLQPLGLLVANSIFIGDYLTAKGQRPEDDLAMIRDLGLRVQGAPETREAEELRAVEIKSRSERLGPQRSDDRPS